MIAPKLDVRRSLEVLERLKETVTEFAKREERTVRGLEVRRSGIAWRFQAGTSGDQEGEASQLAEAENHFNEREARVRHVAQVREARVHRVSAQALRNLPRKGRDARGNWLANLQVRLLEADTARGAALRAAEEEAALGAATLTELCARLVLLKGEARKGVSGYAQIRDQMAAQPVETPDGADGIRLVTEAIEEAEARLAAFRKFSVGRLFQFVQKDAKQAGIALAEAVVKADHIYEAVRVRQAEALEAARQAIQDEYQRTHAEISEQWGRVDEIEAECQEKGRAKIETQTPRLLAKIQEREARLIEEIATARQRRLTRIREEFAAKREAATSKYEQDQQQWNRDEIEEWRTLEEQWKAEIIPIYNEIWKMQGEGEALFPAWSDEWIDKWEPAQTFPLGAKFGELKVDVKSLAGAMPKDPRLALPGPAEFSLPLALSFPQQGSLLIEAKESGMPQALGTLNALVLRLLAASPPGKISCTIIDPVGLGENFAGLMFLSDYEETLINRRIWTQQNQIDERLSELNEHIEKVIQMYLRNEYETITEYNEKAGSVAEKYHFVIIADFPAQFSETAARRLQSIASSGPRCGVFTFVQWDQRQNPPENLAIEEMRRNSVCVQKRGDGYFLAGSQPEGTQLVLEAPPEPELSAKLVHKTGKSSIDSNRVQVPFSQISPGPGEMWTNDTTQELKIAIGRSGATKPQYLAIGKGTRQHALFAGKTGSGKSTLFHVIITNLALSCSPKQVEFYLIDFKKGVEFKCYAEKRLPHARVVAIESDREFALSVLQRVDDELRRRGDMFRKLGVQDLPGYKRAGGKEEIPRTLLIIDEFQEFFVEDDTIAQNASLLFDRIVRQGRAFGIHVLLGSQTLGGAYTLARATLGQMVIRVALQCNEADAYLIMDDNNSAPRLLSRPGEGIYNDAAGAVEGNSPFQVVWLGDDERDRLLDEMNAMAADRRIQVEPPIVFEGNAPSDVRDNELLRKVIDKPPVEVPEVGLAWIGAPNSIKGPTETSFHRQSGSNLLVVGQREEASLSLMGLSLLALGAQYPPGGARFYFFQGSTEGQGPAFVESVARALPHEVKIVTPHESAAAMNEISVELKNRMTNGAYGAGPVFVFVNGMHKFKKLRHEEDFSFSASDEEAQADPGAQFDELIREGAAYGMHLLVTIDAYNNVTRFISRKGITEFEMRVVFQMSANDSASLIDSPRASGLGLHRALFFNEREGTLETFRPYALPEGEWIEEAVAKIAARRSAANAGVSENAGVSAGPGPNGDAGGEPAVEPRVGLAEQTP
jgi:hypothetical protein